MHAEPVSEFSEPELPPDPPVEPVSASKEPSPPEVLPDRGPLDMLRHWWPVVAAALAWIGFGWAWIVIFLDRASSVSLGGPSVLGLYFVSMLTATLVWRAHNRRLHAKLGPRQRIPRVRETWRVDHCGRVLRADWSAVRAARVVHVDVADEVKSFRPGDPA